MFNAVAVAAKRLTDSDSDFSGQIFVYLTVVFIRSQRCCLYPYGSQVRLRLKHSFARFLLCALLPEKMQLFADGVLMRAGLKEADSGVTTDFVPSRPASFSENEPMAAQTPRKRDLSSA